MRSIIFFAFYLFLSTQASAQWMLINSGGGEPDSSAALEIRDTTRGLLIPRLTQLQINAIANPVEGLMVYNTDSSAFRFYNGSGWTSVSSGGSSAQGLADVLGINNNAGGDTIKNLYALSIGADTVFASLFVRDTINTVAVNVLSDSTGSTLQLGLNAIVNANASTSSATGVRGSIGGNPNSSIGVWGVNAASAGTRYGLYGQVSGSGSSAYGVYSQVTGTGTANYGVFSTATGATNNYSGYFASGKFIVLDTVGILTTTPGYTLDVNGNASVNALNVNGAYDFPTVDGTAGEALVTDGSGTLSWDTPNDRHWTQGTGVIYNNSADQLVIGNTTGGSSVKFEVETPNSTAYQTGVLVDNNYNGTNDAVGIRADLTGTGTGGKYGLDNTITGQATQTSTNMGVRSNITPAGTHWSYGVNTTITAGGTGRKIGVQNSITGNASQTGELYGEFSSMNPGAGETVYGNNIQISNSGTGARYGFYTRVQIPTGSNSSYGSFYRLEHESASNIFGNYIDMSGAGSGGRYAFYSNFSGTGTGVRYGLFLNGATVNYIGGNLGVGDISSPAVNLHVRSSASPTLMVESSTTGAVTLNLRNTGTTFSLRNLNGELSILDGTNNRLTIEASGEVGIGTQNPTSMLEVVGDVEIPAVNNYTYSTAKTHYQSFAPTTFNSLLPDQYAFGTNAAADFYAYFRSGGTAFGYATVEVNLPDSASVTELRAWIYDNSNTNPVRVTLYRQALGSSAIAAMAEVESAAATATTAVQNLSDATITNAVIDNANYAYFLFFTGRQASTDTRLYGARISYAVTKTD